MQTKSEKTKSMKHALRTVVAAALCAISLSSVRAQGGEPQGGNGAAQQAPSRPQSGLPGAPQGGTGAPDRPSAAVEPRHPRIGVALGGGGALALSEIGVLRWMEENHVPVDVIAGTSMGSLLGALYATGHTPDQMEALTSDRVFSRVFRLSQDFRLLNFRRKEDARFLPGGFGVGLKHGVSLRSGVLLDAGLNAFLNAQFLPYGADYKFDDMPLPFRCVATDILVGREAIFTQGPLAQAVRASISIPGVFPPLEDGGHIYVDGALTENLPTDVVKSELHADVIIAVSLPLTPPVVGDTGSVLGVLGRSFSVASWSNEVRSRQLANVIVEPVAPPGVGTADYTRSADLAKAGYAAAEKMRSQLLKYRIGDAAWAEYVERRHKREATKLKNVNTVTVFATTKSAALGVANDLADLSGKPVNPDVIDARMDAIRADERFDTDYFLSRPGQVLDYKVTGPANNGRDVQGRELLHPKEKRGPGDEMAAQLAQVSADAVAAGERPAEGGNNTISNNPVERAANVANAIIPGKGKPLYETVAPLSSTPVQVAQYTMPKFNPGDGDVDITLWVRDKRFGPPFLTLGGNIIAQTGGTARASVDALIVQQGLGGYGSEGRLRMRIGTVTEFMPEYYWRLTTNGIFVAPRLIFHRSPEPIFVNQTRVAIRNTQMAGGGLDFGFSQSTYTEWRLGGQWVNEHWNTTTGNDGRPNYFTSAGSARVQYRFNGQDGAMVPRHGLRVESSAGIIHVSRNSNAPRLEGSASYFRDIGHGNTLSFNAEGGTMFNRNIVDPFRFTLGGPLRLTASAFDEYRGTDYEFLRPAYFRRIANLPQPLGQSVYIVGAYEFGQVFAPGVPTVTRNDFFLGLAAETPLGAITFGPAIGDAGHRKLIFSLGRFF